MSRPARGCTSAWAPAQALATVSRCLDVARDAALLYGGRLVKTIGDEVMLGFSTALQAAEAAVEIQQAHG